MTARDDPAGFVRARLAGRPPNARSGVLTDFAEANAALVTGTLVGDGPERTVVSLAPHSSTRAGRVPPQSAAPATNPLTVLKSPKREPDWCLSGLTLLGSQQGHNFSLLRLDTLADPLVHDVVLADAYGDAMGPPGETHVLNVYRCTGSLVSRVLVDGRGHAATGIGHPYSSRITLRDVRVTGCTAWGTAFFRASDIDTENLVLDGNARGLNHECCDGPIRHRGLFVGVPAGDHPTLMHMTLQHDSADNPDVEIGLAGWSGGRYGPSSPFCVRISDGYHGDAQRQTTLPRITGPDGTLLRWADAGRSASADGRHPRIAPRRLDEALADPLHWAVRHH